MTTHHNFGKVFDSVAEKFDDIINPYAFERRHQIIVPYLQGRVLNVGSGTGVFTHPGENVSYTFSMDLSFNMCKVMIRKQACHVLCGNAEFLPFPNNSFDTVVSLEMVYYLNSPERFFQEAYRVLAPGGVLVVTSANHSIARFYAVLRGLFRKFGMSGSYFDDPVKRLMTRKELQDFFLMAGFTILAERNILTLPVKWMKRCDELIEKTPLSRFSMFMGIAGKKPGSSVSNAS